MRSPPPPPTARPSSVETVRTMSASNPSAKFPRPLVGSLALYKNEPICLPYFDTDPSLSNSLVFIPGLTDTIGSVGYLALLADAIKAFGYSLVQPQLSSHLGGYGLCSLEGDAQEIASCIAHLRSLPIKSQGNVILMGHSTGCQDIVAYLLSSTRAHSVATRIDGAILQAPISDREDYEYRTSLLDSQQQKRCHEKLQLAKQLVDSGKGAELMSRFDDDLTTPQPESLFPQAPPDLDTPSDTTDSKHDDDQGNSSAVLTPAMTAYRYYSLFAKGGDDDFFSSDLTDQQLCSAVPGARTLGRAIHNLSTHLESNHHRRPAKMLALMSQKDEFLPPHICPTSIVNRWTSLFASSCFTSKLLTDANHKVDEDVAQTELIQTVIHFIQTM